MNIFDGLYMQIDYASVEELFNGMREMHISLDMSSLEKFVFQEESFITIKEIKEAGVIKEDDRWSLYIPIPLVTLILMNEYPRKKYKEEKRINHRKQLTSLRKIYNLY